MARYPARHTSFSAGVRSTAVFAVAGVIASVGVLGGSAAVAAPVVEEVVVAADGTIAGWYDGGSGIADPWWVEQHLDGSSLRISTPDNQTVTLMRDLTPATPPPSGPATDPSQITDLIAGGLSYTTDGVNTNLQLSIRYKPANPAGGPTSICGNSAVFTGDWAGWCWTILKYEPTVGSTGWTTKTLVNPLEPSDSGWWGNTGRTIGANIPANTWYKDDITFFTSEMSELVIAGVGVSIGSAAGATGANTLSTWVKDLTWRGVTHRFITAQEAPAAPPAADTDELETYIDDNSIDVAGSTANFIPTGSANTDLGKIDRSKTLNGTYENWQDPTDSFVDVYSYSTANLLGSFPVVGSNVLFSNLNLSSLSTGPHYLLLQGQTSGTVGVVLFNIIGLASTGAETETVVMLGVAATSLLALGVWFALGAARVRRRDTAPH